jgi:peptide/nickel transport system permease protein
MASDDAQTDAAGGPDDSPFTTTAEFETSASDRVLELLDIWIISPAKVLWDDYRGRTGLLLVSIYILMGTVGVSVIRFPEMFQGPRLVQPFENMAYPLGTDGQGRGMLALMVHATPAMLKMVISGTLFGGVMGIAVGMTSGYMGGTVDKVLMTVTDTVGSIPGLPLLLILVAIIEPTNPWLVGIILNVQGWAGGSRGIRAQVLPLRNKEYVEASKAMGESTSNLLFKEILPELLPMIFIGFLGGATGIINASVGLYFIGVLPYSNLNWGVVLQSAYSQSGALYSPQAAHWLLVPLVTITGLNFAFVMLAQAFDQVFNPRVRARHERRKRSEEQEQMMDEDGDSATAEMSDQFIQ